MTDDDRKKEEAIKGTFMGKTFELLQWIVLGGLFVRKPGQPSGEATKEEGMPDWLLSLLAPFTDEDEVIYAQLLDTISDPDQTKVDKFRLELIKHGWDEDIFRLRLVKNFRDALEKKKLMKNSATRTLQQLAGADGDYAEQERIALSKKLLVKISGRKKSFHWITDHKLETLVGIFIILPLFIIWLLN